MWLEMLELILQIVAVAAIAVLFTWLGVENIRDWWREWEFYLDQEAKEGLWMAQAVPG